VLSFVREFGDDIVLCVNNLSRFPQPVELDLRRFEGWTPIELTGRVEFPQIGVLPYMLTLAGHGFYWFELSRPEVEAPAEEFVPEDEREPVTTSSVAEALVASGVVHPDEETTETGPSAPSDSPGGPR
jgi:maltose alpha-D-glucosyltransferase/alpha-amylase